MQNRTFDVTLIILGLPHNISYYNLDEEESTSGFTGTESIIITMQWCLINTPKTGKQNATKLFFFLLKIFSICQYFHLDEEESTSGFTGTESIIITMQWCLINTPKTGKQNATKLFFFLLKIFSICQYFHFYIKQISS